MKDEKGRLPSYQWYPADWRSDPGVQSLSFHERGIWREMLDIMHESDDRGKLLLNGKAMPIEALAAILGLMKQDLEIVIKKLLDYGVASRNPKNSVIFSRRMVRDERIRLIRKKCGELGGNPNLLNQKSTTRVKQKSTPSSSSSPASADQHPNTLVVSAETTPAQIPYGELLTAYNERRGALPQATGLSAGRKKKLRARWNEHPDIKFWQSVFGRAGKSEVMLKWASFDWLIKSEDNYTKTIEGNYENDRERKSVPRPAAPPAPREKEPTPAEAAQMAREAEEIFGEWRKRKKVGTFSGPVTVTAEAGVKEPA